LDTLRHFTRSPLRALLLEAAMSRLFYVALTCFAFAALTANNFAVAQETKEEKPVVLKVGDEAPEFTAKDDAGEDWKSVEHVGKKILVVYFYPKDMTPGCTKQACTYRDSLPQLEKEGVEVIGVSRDTVESHKKFKEAEKLNFTLLADPEGKITKAFGVKPLVFGQTELASRWTFVIDPEGHIAYKNEKVDPLQDPAEVMKVVAKLQKK
jgi:peroxiredoxin Q/BCP